MSYKKHNFKPGDILYASDLNEMEDQIASNEKSIAEGIPTSSNEARNLPIGKCLFKYSGAKVKSTINDSAVALSKYDLFVYDGHINNSYNSSSEDSEILSMAKRLNPNLKIFHYFSVASVHNNYTLDADGTWNESNPVSKIHTRSEITEFLKRLKHAGGSVSTDSNGNTTYSGGLEFDGVFYDEFDTDSAVGLTNQGGWNSIVEKQNELIDEAHSFGLSVFANAWDITSMVSGVASSGIYNPSGLSTRLGSDDYILFESNEYYPGAGDSTDVLTWSTYSVTERIYNYTSTYYNKVKAKAVSYSYAGKNWTTEEKEIALTWIIYNTVAMGGHYIHCSAFMDYDIPENLAVFTLNEASVPTYSKLDKGMYSFSCNGHTLITHRYTIDSSVLEVNLETLKQTVVYIDDRAFLNAFIKAPEYSYAISEKLENIEEELEGIYNSSQKMSSIYHRAFIDDWVPEITPQSFTNIIPNANGSPNLMTVTRDGYNINGKIDDGWGSYRWIIDARPYRGKTLEFGCSLYTQSWDSTGNNRLWLTIYDGDWNNSSKTVIYPYTRNDSLTNNVSRINLAYTVSETQTEIYVGFWAQGATSGATFVVNDLYLVDPSELEDDILIRGEDPSNTYIRLNRVTSEKYAMETELETDSLYIINDGRLVVTDGNGDIIVETLALSKDSLRNEILQIIAENQSV